MTKQIYLSILDSIFALIGALRVVDWRRLELALILFCIMWTLLICLHNSYSYHMYYHYIFNLAIMGLVTNGVYKLITNFEKLDAYHLLATLFAIILLLVYIVNKQNFDITIHRVLAVVLFELLLTAITFFAINAHIFTRNNQR